MHLGVKRVGLLQSGPITGFLLSLRGDAAIYAEASQLQAYQLKKCRLLLVVKLDLNS